MPWGWQSPAILTQLLGEDLLKVTSPRSLQALLHDAADAGRQGAVTQSPMAPARACWPCSPGGCCFLPWNPGGEHCRWVSSPLPGRQLPRWT